MPADPNRLIRFWNELKRRNVIRRNTVYAATAFVILEFVSIIQEPLKLPDWSLPFLIILLSIGLILSIIISWIYDVNPEGGLEKTKSLEKIAKTKEASQESTPASSVWKMASYISFGVILVLVILNIIPRTNLWKGRNLPDRSIAVIPFMNDSPEEEKMYFINGTMEEILDNLSRIEDLKVISRTTVEQYRENRKTVPVIAEELDVGYVVEGSGQRDGDQVRITVQLLDKNDRHIWTESYVREIENVFDLQKEVARLVAREVEQAIDEEAIQKRSDRSDNSAFAEALFEKGYEIMRQYWEDTWNLGLLETAEVLFRFGLEYDSTYVGAYAQLAHAYNMRYWRTSDKDVSLDSALVMINKAIQYNPRNAGYYSFKGSVLARRGQSDEALEAYNMAVSIDPREQQSLMGILDNLIRRRDYVKALDLYRKYFVNGTESTAAQKSMAWVMLDNGFKEEAQRLVERTLQLDGDSTDYNERMGRIELGSGSYKGAIEYFLKAEKSDPGNYLGWLAISYYFDRQFDKSMEHYIKQIDKIGPDGNPWFPRYAGYVFIHHGETRQGEQYLQMNVEANRRNMEMGYLRSANQNMAEILAYRGEKEEALRHLREFVKQEGITGFEISIFASPMFDNLREEPEFIEICEQAEAKARVYHEEIGQWLEENEIL